MRKKVKRENQTQLILKLEQQVEELKAQAATLEAQHKKLSAETRLLACCCDMLHALRSGAVHPGWRGFVDSWCPTREVALLESLNSQFADLGVSSRRDDTQPGSPHSPQLQQTQEKQSPLAQDKQKQLQQAAAESQQQQQEPAPAQAPGTPDAQEQRLQQQRSEWLFSPSLSCSSCEAASAASPPPELTSVSCFNRPDDPLAPLRFTLAQEPYPGAGSMTMQQLAARYSATIKECSLHLFLLDQQREMGDDACLGQQSPLALLDGLLAQHFRLIVCLMLLHPEDILSRLRVLNCNTLELSDTPEQAWRRTCWLADKVDLTEEQQYGLVTGAGVFRRLIDAIRAERQQLSVHLGEQASERDARTGRALDLQGQEDAAARLAVLVRKERFLATAASVYACSVLDVVRLARVGVLGWPFSPHLGMMAAAVAAKQAGQLQGPAGATQGGRGQQAMPQG